MCKCFVLKGKIGIFACNLCGFIGLGQKWGEGWVIFPFLRLPGLRRKSRNGGDGGGRSSRPDGSLAAGIFADGCVDVVHGWRPGLVGILTSFLHCAPGEANYMQTFLRKNSCSRCEDSSQPLERLELGEWSLLSFGFVRGLAATLSLSLSDNLHPVRAGADRGRSAAVPSPEPLPLRPMSTVVSGSCTPGN
jgi:hypothetical protein